MTKGLLIYFLFINIAGFVVCYLDKRAAIKNRWRVPEKNIFLFGFAGGGIGVFTAMLLLRHKTKHWKFMTGIPLIIILNVYVFMRLMERIGN